MQANAHQTARAHCDGAPVHYARHRPEQTTLYRLVQQHSATFFAQAEETTGADLPQFVKDEFDAFLTPCTAVVCALAFLDTGCRLYGPQLWHK